ncbi:hypothetical protein DIPPA_05962 [Diplonema papillatum]|nr:hypothetical protein DIPPA_05962 [Diplonema papillatum]
MDDDDGPARPKKAPDRPNLSHLSPRRSSTGSASPLLGAARVGSASHPASCAGDPSLGVFAALQHHVVGKDDAVVQLKRQFAAATGSWRRRPPTRGRAGCGRTLHAHVHSTYSAGI